MTSKELLYEGKAKRLFATEDETLLIAYFKDDLTAFNGEKKSAEAGKGALNCKISAQIFQLLEENGIPTHFVKQLDDNRMVVKNVDIIPIEVVVRNVAAGSLCRRFGLEEGVKLPFSVVEFYYKDDALGDPLMNDEHALMLELVESESELEELKRLGREVNVLLHSFFASKGLNLVDFKLEFGIDEKGKILLADEISPDSCRFWDMQTNEKLDKDRFRQNLGNLKLAYKEVLRRMTGGEA